MMDDETREALTAILGVKRDAKKKSTRRTASIFSDIGVPPASTASEEFKAAFEYAFAKTEFTPPPPTTAAFCVPLSMMVDSTKDLTAILSVNNSKACVVLRAKYTTEFLKVLKALNSSDTKWNDKDQVFELHPSVLPQLKLMLKDHFKDVSVLGINKQVKATKFDLLMSKLDSEDKKKIYSLLARKYHPDVVGGNKDTMTLVNLVFKGGD